MTRIIAAAAVSLAALAALVITGPSAAATPASQSPSSPRPNSPSTGVPLYAFDSQWVLSTIGKLARGAKVTTGLDRDQAGQRWLFRSDGTIRPAARQGLCLSAASGFQTGVQLTVGRCGGGATQRFSTRTPSAHTPVLFIEPASRRALCLTAAGGLVTRSPIELAACASSDQQAWATTRFNDDPQAYSVGTIGPYYGTAIAPGEPVKSGSHAILTRLSSNLRNFWVAVPTAPFTQPGSEVTLRPLGNTSLCLTTAPKERAGSPLSLTTCDGEPSQQFTGVQIQFTAGYYWALLLSHDARSCVTSVGKTVGHMRTVLESCRAGINRLYTDLSLLTYPSYQYADLYLGDPNRAGFQYEALDAPHDGSAGTKVVTGRDRQPESGQQIWTDLAPGSLQGGNPDGSLSLRPLYDLNLCLTVPNANYQQGIQLQVQACDGNADQDFVRNLAPTDPQDGTLQTLSPAGDSSACVGVDGTIGGGKPVELRDCSDTFSQTWSTWQAGF
jgi:hypothetical protein